MTLKVIKTPESTGTKGGRRPTEVPVLEQQTPDPEVVARPPRRRLTVAYKLKVLDMVSSLRSQGNGAIGAYLRKEGLYYSSIRSWERLREKSALSDKRPGPAAKSRKALAAENKKLRRALEQTKKRLRKTELIVELQKKISALMELNEESPSERSAKK